jgi:hypothetical protein
MLRASVDLPTPFKGGRLGTERLTDQSVWKLPTGRLDRR